MNASPAAVQGTAPARPVPQEWGRVRTSRRSADKILIVSCTVATALGAMVLAR